MKQFHATVQNDCVELRLKAVSKKIFQKDTMSTESISEWNGLSHFVQVEALGTLFAAMEENSGGFEKLDDDEGYRVSFDFISTLNEAHALAFGLPKSFPHSIRIKSTSNIGSKNYSIDWVAFGNGRQLNVRRVGCFLFQGNEVFRLTADIWKIIECIDEFNSSGLDDFESKTTFVSELRSLLPEVPDGHVHFDGELAEVSLQHAVAFSLQITGDKNSINFNPVLFNKVTKERASESDTLIEEDEQVLTPNEARNFSAAFKKSGKVNASYLLGKGKYVFIDKSLRPALGAVKTAIGSPKDVRVEFAKAPQKFIKNILERDFEGLPDVDVEIASENIDRIFIETRQFSDRVTGIGLWQAPDLPWLESEPQDWRADSYSFYVQGKTISIPTPDLEKEVEKLSLAVQTGATQVEIGGQIVKPDQSFLNFLMGLLPVRPEGPPQPKGPPGPDEPPEPEKEKGTFVLLTKENFDSVQYNSRLAPRLDALSAELPECKNPKIVLKAHQTSGLNWLVESYNCGYPGVLMADDMGLGKTLQALIFLAIMVETGKTDSGEPILIVAPVGLLKNWEEEHSKHLSGEGLGSFARLYGNSLKGFKVAKGRDIESGNATLNTDKIKGHDWLLTTYETLRDYQASFGQIRFSCIVFDEIQKAKNPRGLIYNSAKGLNRDFVLGLTGTPVENSLSDLWTIMDVISPGRLGDLKTFMSSYPEPRSENAQEALENLKQLSVQLLEPSANGPAPVIRRMKSDLSDAGLPKKSLVPSMETTVLMPRIQDDEYIARSNQLNSGQTSMIEALHAFKSISLHPISPVQFEQFSIDEYIKASARLSKTFEILERIHKQNEKVLIFLESRKFQVVLASLVREKFKMDHSPLIINGLISGEARQERVNTFQSNPIGFDVMIISPKAGGVGLTLTAANNVIHLERWWNPAVEDQCTDRAYRIGQTKTVNVYTPLAKNGSFGEKSFDCILDRLLNEKRSIAKGLFVPTSVTGAEFGGAFREGARGRELSLEEIDCFERGEEFESYVISHLKSVGLKASKTQLSYDYGADIIVKNEKTSRCAIVQCKHRSSGSKSVSQDAVNEVLNAVSYYDLGSPKLIVVTNAGSATAGCRSVSDQNGVILLLRDKLLSAGQVICDLLD